MESVTELAKGTAQGIRYEHKMTSGQHNLPDVLAIVRKHGALFRTHHPNRIVNNVYFDTPGLLSYFKHISGAANREKIRIRWYGNPISIIENPVLERKVKYGQVGAKFSEILPSIEIDKSTPWPIPVHIRKDGETMPIHWRTKILIPQVVLRYERYYFINASGDFRLTVDTNLEYFGLSGGLMSRTPPKSAPIIIELKYDRERATDAHVITQDLPFRLTQFSKYLYALEGTNGN